MVCCLNLLFAALVVLIAVLEIPPLIKKRLFREFAVFLVLFVFGLAVTVLFGLSGNLPSPITGAKYLIEDVLRISYH